MYSMFGPPWVTWTGADHCRPNADEESITASCWPGPLASHTAYMCPVLGSPAAMGRQQRMAAGPEPMLLATIDRLLHLAPPSVEVCATSVGPPWPVLPCPMMGPRVSFPNGVPLTMYTSTSVPSGSTNGWEFWVDCKCPVTKCVALQCRPWSSDQRTTCGDPPLDRNAVQNW